MSHDLMPAQRSSESFRGPKPNDSIFTNSRASSAFAKKGGQRGGSCRGVLLLPSPSPGKTPQRPPQRRSPPPTSPSTPPKFELRSLSCIQPGDKTDALVADLYQEYFTKPDSLCTPDIRETTGQTQSNLLKPLNDHHFDDPVKAKSNIDLCAPSLVDNSKQGSLTKDRTSKSSLFWKISGSADSFRIALVSLSASIFFALVILCLLMLQFIIQLESSENGYGGLVPT